MREVIRNAHLRAPLFRFRNIMRKLLNLDIFNLGFSFTLYYVVIFSILPIALAVGLTTEFTNLEARGINVLNKKSFTYLLAGLLAFLLGYYSLRKGLRHRSLSDFLDKPWNPSRSLWVTFGVLITGFAIKCPRIISDLAEPNSDISITLSSFLSLNPFHFIALAIAFSQYFFLLRNHDDQANLWGRIAWPLFVFEFLGQVKFGAGRMSILTPILIYLLTRHYLYRRCTGRIIVIGLAILLLVFPIKLYMKDKVNLDQNYFTEHQEQSFIQTLSSDLVATSSLVIDSSIGRLGQSHIFTAIVDHAEQLLYGQGFLDFFRAFNITTLLGHQPRFLNDGNDFGKAIGILRTNDVITGIGPTQIGDMYLNFGLLGVVIGMLLLGVLYRYLFENLVVTGSISGIMLYSILWIQIIHGFEDWVSLTYIRHIKILFVLFLIHSILTTDLQLSNGYRFISSRLTTLAKRLWSGGSNLVCLSFITLVLVSTTLSISIPSTKFWSNTNLEKLAIAGVYQELLRDLDKCEQQDGPFFRDSLPRDHFSYSIREAQATQHTAQNAYLMGLVDFEKGNDEGAKAWFRMAARKEHPIASYNLGLMYEHGYGVTKNINTAMNWYRKAEQQNFLPAITSLGRLYLNNLNIQNASDQAFQYFSRAANQGDAQAQTSLGSMYHSGISTHQDFKKALGLFRKAAAQGNSQAMVQLAQFYESRTDISPDSQMALSLYQHAAHLGDVSAMRKLSDLYESGLIIPKSEEIAQQWKMRSHLAETIGKRSELIKQYYSEMTKWARVNTKLEDAAAMRTLGVLYAEGLAVPKDLNQAFEWFNKASRLNDVPSMRNLGIMYERGFGVTENTTEAKKWYMAAASEGDSIASKNIGNLYELGRQHDPINLTRAYNWYSNAANLGNSTAMCKLGRMYYRAESVPRSFAIAAQWFKDSAGKGNATAMNNLGLLYELGRGVDVNYGSAFQWYERSAHNGIFAAMRNLALMYEKGRGVERNYDQAIQWYQKAGRGGDSIAQTKLSKL